MGYYKRTLFLIELYSSDKALLCGYLNKSLLYFQMSTDFSSFTFVIQISFHQYYLIRFDVKDIVRLNKKKGGGRIAPGPGFIRGLESSDPLYHKTSMKSDHQCHKPGSNWGLYVTSTKAEFSLKLTENSDVLS